MSCVQKIFLARVDVGILRSRSTVSLPVGYSFPSIVWELDKSCDTETQFERNETAGLDPFLHNWNGSNINVYERWECSRPASRRLGIVASGSKGTAGREGILFFSSFECNWIL